MKIARRTPPGTRPLEQRADGIDRTRRLQQGPDQHAEGDQEADLGQDVAEPFRDGVDALCAFSSTPLPSGHFAPTPPGPT
jgi:hypothetical protein